jgi:multidrug efflux system outer membrane protein
MLSRTFRLAAVASATFVTAACAVGPDYKRPEVKMPEKWRDPAAAQGASIANVPWWDLFQDPQLKTLIKVALEENRDLKIAVERIEEMRAALGIAKADLYPKLSADLHAGALNPSNTAVVGLPSSDTNNTTGLYVATLDLSWELDFFGRIRRATEAQKALLLASEEARRAVAIALVADVATAYLDLRGLDRRLAISRDTITSRKESVEYSKTRFQGSVSDEVAWRQAESELHRVEAITFDFEKLVAQKENELSFLLGHNPEAIVRTVGGEDQPVPPQVPADLPAQLLERRPDVRRAEMELMSTNAQIGEAKAMLYPQITLTASYGLASTDLASLIDPASQTWRLFAGLMQPIFNAGKNQARVEMRESQNRQALYAYENTLLQALREVEDSLVGMRKAGEERGAQDERVTAQKRVLELADLRYRGGVATYLEVLDAQRSLFNAQLDEASAATEHSKALVRLYKALGGGWPTGKAAEEQAAKSKGGTPTPASAPTNTELVTNPPAATNPAPPATTPANTAPPATNPAPPANAAPPTPAPAAPR